MTQEKTPKFEEALVKLESIVGQMESGQLSLEESMKKFEEGMTLTQFCSKKLGETEKKIEILVQKAGATLEWEKREDEAGE